MLVIKKASHSSQIQHRGCVSGHCYNSWRIKGIKSLLTELGIIVSMPLQILSDSQRTTFIAKNPVCHTKMKHVAMDLGFVRENRKLDSTSEAYLCCSTESRHPD